MAHSRNTEILGCGVGKTSSRFKGDSHISNITGLVIVHAKVLPSTYANA